jgi:hypothetical protein
MFRPMILALMISISPLQDGDARSALSNGMLYLNGEGVARDHHRALVWFYIAEALDHKLARPYVGLVAPFISAKQRDHARIQANHCLLGKGSRCNLLLQ